MLLYPNKTQRGLTLVELIVTLAVTAILGTLAVTGFQSLIVNQRLRATSYDLISDLVLARSEALKRSKIVQLVPSVSGWAGGWTLQVQSGGETLSQRNAIGPGVIVTSAPGSVTFDVNGRLATGSSVSFRLTDGAARKRCIKIDTSGRPKSVEKDCV